jgi:hypothetical protein
MLWNFTSIIASLGYPSFTKAATPFIIPTLTSLLMKPSLVLIAIPDYHTTEAGQYLSIQANTFK